MRLSYSLGSLLSIHEILDCAKIIQNSDVVWIPETWGMENFAMLSAVSQNVKCKIGSSIVNIYSRSPALIGMGAVTLDVLSQGRLVLGLGSSTAPIVENLHGLKFSNPLARMREYVQIIRKVISGNMIHHTGMYDLKGFTLLTKPFRREIPIYLAAVNQKMVDLSWEIADGTILYLRPLQEMKQTIQKMQSKKNIDVACQIITAVSQDSQTALDKVKKTILFYVSVGKIYREFLSKNGFKNEVKNIYEEKSIQQVPDSMADALTIYGTPDECVKKLKLFRDAQIDLPIIQFNPIGNTIESFKQVTSAFSGEHN